MVVQWLGHERHSEEVPIPMTLETKPLDDKRIGIFGKGGAGKSTVVVLLSKALRDYGYTVCVLDADSTNVGLHLALGLDDSPTPLMEYYGGTVFGGGAVTCPVDDPRPLPGAEVFLDTLDQRYHGQNQDGISLLVAGKIGGQGPGAGCDGPVSKIARDLKVRRQGESLVTLIDFKAGIEDSARGVITSLDWAIVVVDPTNASIQMAADMRLMVDQIKAGVLPATGHLDDPELVETAKRVFREARIKGVLCVLNRVRDAEMERHMRRRLAEKQVAPVAVVQEDASIAMAWLEGTFLHGAAARADTESIVRKLEEAEQAMS